MSHEMNYPGEIRFHRQQLERECIDSTIRFPFSIEYLYRYLGIFLKLKHLAVLPFKLSLEL